jgi:hypothetical protein
MDLRTSLLYVVLRSKRRPEYWFHLTRKELLLSEKNGEMILIQKDAIDIMRQIQQD